MYFTVMVKRSTKVGFYANLSSKESYNVMGGVKGFQLDLRAHWRCHGDGGRELCGHLEKMLKDNGDKIPDDKKSAVEAANNELQEALKGTAADAIKAATEKLQQVVQDASQDIYKAAQEAQAAGQAGGAEPDGNADAGQAEEAKKDEGPIIDAEVVEEKKD